MKRLALLAAALIGLPALAGFQIKTVDNGMEIHSDGSLFTRYVTDIGEGNKPYLWPVIGPNGKEMTRAYPMEKREGEAHDHPHHRSMCFGHENIAGFNTWHEKATLKEGKKNAEAIAKEMEHMGTIKHRAFREVKADENGASFLAVSDHVRPDGSRFLTEETRYSFRSAPGQRIIDVDLDLIASDGPVKVTDIKDAGYSVRVAHSMAVDSKQGGVIVNAEGLKNGEAWGTRSAWVDYTGPVAGETAGVTMFNHPTSFRYPTPWHVRTYGLFTANPFGTKSVDRTKKGEDGTFELAKGERIKLRLRFVYHTGAGDPAAIAAAFKAYAAEAK